MHYIVFKKLKFNVFFVLYKHYLNVYFELGLLIFWWKVQFLESLKF